MAKRGHRIPQPLKMIFEGSTPAAMHREISPPETTSNPVPRREKMFRMAKFGLAWVRISYDVAFGAVSTNLNGIAKHEVFALQRAVVKVIVVIDSIDVVDVQRSPKLFSQIFDLDAA